MAAGRKPRPEEQPFGGEVIGVANIALAIFFTLAFYSYQAGDAGSNSVGLIGYLLADLFCPAFGQACYLLPLALLYFAGVLLHQWQCPALISQLLSFGTFLVTTAALLALWGGQRPVTEAGGWVGGFLALHLRTGLNLIGAHLLLVPVLLMSFMGMTRVSLSDTGVGVFATSYALIVKGYTLIGKLGVVFTWFDGLLSRLTWERPELPEPEIAPTKRASRRDSVAKKAPAPILLEEEEGKTLCRRSLLLSPRRRFRLQKPSAQSRRRPRRSAKP